MTKQERIDRMDTYRKQWKKRRETLFAPFPAFLFFSLLAEEIWWLWTGLMALLAAGLIVSLWKEADVFARLSDKPEAQRATRNVYWILIGWLALTVGSVVSYKLVAPWWVWVLLVCCAVMLMLFYNRSNKSVSKDPEQPLRSELATARGVL
ncbi:hypothetical protein [Exiguobacterium sp. SH0S2]|uniref:hypothetical protein n=1 Tax=Exiguobacterium sp. SH0S2 TaxID=2510950 RepID=UPI0010D00719|nr:hypothetical protein [Exiguobacterium sp. SH0S2]TCI59374.1 hypothetical protein EVJ21_13620 [Exiguobacterium sp. SH0S2]